MPNLTSTQVQPVLSQQQQIAAAAARQGLPPNTGLSAPALPVAGAQTGAHTLTTPGAYGPGQSISGLPAGTGGAASPGAAGALGPAPDAVNVRNPTADWGGFNNFNDAVYNDATRHLDPQWADQQRQFDQQMINQGLSPGTQAYQQAYDNFNRSKNDAYGSARNQGLQAALAAQNQFFGQNLSESQLANALARAQLESSTALGTANIGANASMYNAGLGRETAMDTNALNRELGLGDLGIRADTLAQNGSQNDWENMMGMFGLDFGIDQYNNGLLNSDFGRGQSMLGLIPNVNPGNIDANGAYQINAGQQQNAYQGQVANANGQNQAAASAASIAVMAMMM